MTFCLHYRTVNYYKLSTILLISLSVSDWWFIYKPAFYLFMWTFLTAESFLIGSYPLSAIRFIKKSQKDRLFGKDGKMPFFLFSLGSIFFIPPFCLSNIQMQHRHVLLQISAFCNYMLDDWMIMYKSAVILFLCTDSKGILL